MSKQDIQSAALAAGRETLRRTREYLETGKDFAVETTLAGSGPIETIRLARSKGFDVRLLFVCVDSVERNLIRVQERVAKGGHFVPDLDVRRRYLRSLENLPEALRLASSATLYDNSGVKHRKILQTESGRIFWLTDRIPEWAKAAVESLGGL